MASNLQRIVVVGGGAGGLELVTSLGKSIGKKKIAKVYLADGHNTHIWKPLFHEVATGSLNTGEDEVNYFAHSYRSHYRFHYGFVNGIDREKKTITTDTIRDLEGNVISGPRETPYDKLVLAVGAQTNDFGTPGVKEFCERLDSQVQAEKLRKKFLAQAVAVAFKKRPKIRIGIVGGGATGVELAAELHHTMTEIRSYGAAIVKDQIEITILEAAPKILPVSTPQIAQFAHKVLTSRGIDIKLNCSIKAVTDKGFVLADGSLFEQDVKIWTAGIKGHDWMSTIGLQTDRINRVKVNQYLQSLDDPSIFAIGDCANTPNPENPDMALPATAQCAHQQAEWLAKKITNDLLGKPTEPFVYKYAGMLVSLGDTTAVGSVTGAVTNMNHHVRGYKAKLLYSALYRMHQAAIYGPIRAGLIWIGDKLRSFTLPKVKLH